MVTQLARLEEGPTQSVNNSFKFNTFVLSVIKGPMGKEKHMYILQDKSQLNSFVNSIRDQLLGSFGFSPKPAKLKELVSRCLGFNSYADVISNLPIDMDEFDYTFPRNLTETLIAEPYGLRAKTLIEKPDDLRVTANNINIMYDNAISNCAYWDDERTLMSINMATDGM